MQGSGEAQVVRQVSEHERVREPFDVSNDVGSVILQGDSSAGRMRSFLVFGDRLAPPRRTLEACRATTIAP